MREVSRHRRAVTSPAGRAWLLAAALLTPGPWRVHGQAPGIGARPESAPPRRGTASLHAIVPTLMQPTSPFDDIESVTTVVRGIAESADARDWHRLATYFAADVTLDYGTPERLAPAAIVARWSTLLSAFERTQHRLDAVTVRISGNRAEATAAFTATHTIGLAAGERTWTLTGQYVWTLAREATTGPWRVTGMRMRPGTSTGEDARIAAEARAASRGAALAPVAADPAHGRPHAVRAERVAFRSGHAPMVGTLYLPAEARAGARLPGVVVTGAWMTVKEQMAGRYARELAARGIAAFVFDFRGWGESGGMVRQREEPSAKIADIAAASAALAARPEIDPARLGGLGICASAGYMVAAAASDPTRLRSVALVAPWLHDAAIVREVYGGEAGVARLVASGRAALAGWATTGAQRFLPAASTTDSSAVMFGVPYYTEADRGMVAAWRNQVDPAFWEGWLTFDGLAAAPQLTQPTVLVHSDAAAIPQGARRLLERVGATDTKALWLEKVTQFDFYDRAEPVRTASDAVAAHFARTLAAAAPDAGAASRAVVERFFTTLEAKDLPAFRALWAADGVQRMPFAPAGFPTDLVGRQAIARQYGGLPTAFRSMRFPRRLASLADPERVLVEYTGEIARADGGRYDNRYIGVFTVRDGRITEFVEYFDPIVLQRAFGSTLGQTFNVDASRGGAPSP